MKVTARFQVSAMLKLRSRPGVFVCGEVIEGAVRSDMTINWPIHGDAVGIAVPIRAVEFIDYSPGIAGVALSVRFEEDEEENEQLLRKFLEVGMIISVWEQDDSVR
jgi:hypothetical protein